MSFVLEALKKQEASTDPEAAVSLARAGVLRRRHRLWMWIAAAAMAGNAALLIWVFGTPAQRTPSAPAPANVAAPGVGAAVTAAGAAPRAAAPATSADRSASADGQGMRNPSAATAVRDSAPAATPRGEAAPAAGAAAVPPSGTATAASAAPAPDAAPPKSAAPAQAGPGTIALADLPPDARARFPGIAFSTHIYSEDPSLRAVFANGKRRHEGDRIRGLEILEITETGVVLAFENYRVEVPVVVDWDSL